MITDMYGIVTFRASTSRTTDSKVEINVESDQLTVQFFMSQNMSSLEDALCIRKVVVAFYHVFILVSPETHQTVGLHS